MSSRPQRTKRTPKYLNNYNVNIPKKKSLPKTHSIASIQTNSKSPTKINKITLNNKSIQTKITELHYQNLLDKLALCHKQLSLYKKKDKITKNLYKISSNSKHSRNSHTGKLRNKFPK